MERRAEGILIENNHEHVGPTREAFSTGTTGLGCDIGKAGGPLQLSLHGKVHDLLHAARDLPSRELAQSGELSTLASVPAATPRMGHMEPLHVLSVEDSDEDFDLVSQSLSGLREPQFMVHREPNLSGAIQYLGSHHVDVALLDLSLPDSTAHQTLVSFRTRAPQVPVVVLTGADSKAQGLRSVQEGADDYLLKSQLQSELLGRTLSHAIERKILVLQRLEALKVEREARSKAEHAVAVRDQFLAIASHELRNPLSAMHLQIQVLIRNLRSSQENDSFDDPILAMALGAGRQIRRFGKLIDTLLDLSTIQSGRLRLELSEFLVNDVVRESLELLGPEIESAGCSVVVDAGLPVQCRADRLRLEQVLSNLISNALKYAPGRPLSISFACDEETVCIRVKDQGPGVARADLERIFSLFERTTLPSSGNVPGLGIGLYVAREIMEAHGGEIRVESELGRGSTFIVKLPRLAAGSPSDNEDNASWRPGH
jgi:signal transduction histidine kinase